MKPWLLSSIILLLFFSACNDTPGKKKENNAPPAEKATGETQTPPFFITDSVITSCNNVNTRNIKPLGKKGLFTTDNFLLPQDTLRQYYRTNNTVHDYHYGDAGWFVSDTLQQTLIISIATDLYRMKMFVFSWKECPDTLLQEVNIYHNDEMVSSIANTQEVKKVLPWFIEAAAKMPSRFFTTERGLQLGDCKEEALAIYGKPHELHRMGSIDQLVWKYEGYMDGANEKLSRRQPVANDSYGHTVTMYFRNNRLIALSIFNDIP